MLDILGLGVSAAGTAGQLWSNWQNQQYTREMQERYEGILGDYFGKTEDYLGQGYETGMEGLRGAYGPYIQAGRGITAQNLRSTGANYNELLRMQGIDATGSMAGWRGREADIGMGYDRLGTDIGGGYGRMTSAIGGGYDERLATAMGMTKEWGTQERKDLLREYGEFGASQQAGLAARGMGGTTIGAGFAQENLREQSGAMARLGDLISRQKLDVYGGMTGEGLLAKERMTGAGLLAGERIGGAGLLAGERVSADTLGMGDYWRNLQTQTASERGFALSDIEVSGMGREADIGFQQSMAGLGMGQEYYGKMANLQMSYPEAWGNFMTANPVEFMDFSPMINYGGQMTSYSQMQQQRRDAKRAQRSSERMGWATLGLAAADVSLDYGQAFSGMGGGGGGGGWSPQTLNYGPWNSYMDW